MGKSVKLVVGGYAQGSLNALGIGSVSLKTMFL